MKRTNKAVLLAAMTGLISYGALACRTADEDSGAEAAEHADGDGDHPEGEHPEGEHPEGDHPEGEHPEGDHPEGA